MKIEEFLNATIEQFRTSHGNADSKTARMIAAEQFPLRDQFPDELGEYITRSLRNVGVDLPEDVL